MKGYIKGMGEAWIFNIDLAGWCNAGVTRFMTMMSIWISGGGVAFSWAFVLSGFCMY
jgi:hypothetical protein